jgi:hypothetical protein
MRSFILCTLLTLLLGNQMKEDEIGSTCSLHGGVMKCLQNFCLKTCRKETACEN